jgi:hypothetical protein
MMEAARTSETSVDIQLRTRQYNPEDSELHTRRRETLNSHNIKIYLTGMACETVDWIQLAHISVRSLFYEYSNASSGTMKDRTFIDQLKAYKPSKK